MKFVLLWPSSKELFAVTQQAPDRLTQNATYQKYLLFMAISGKRNKKFDNKCQQLAFCQHDNYNMLVF